MNIYDKLYAVDGIDYGNIKSIKDSGTEREKKLLREINKVISDNNISGTMSVLEIGASLGYNHQCHPNYLGIEYSSVAVDVAKTRFGLSLNVTHGDATSLDLESGSIDFVFTFATLEHVPEIGNALAEIGRVLRKGGVAYLSPAWNL